ncbi:MAG: peptidyl-prolyl cis-trans isomerase [Oscillospiraceae bacterium]|nr:peptidyl-prolyl cis-trans isomerase [Oscillospiraceae bacterium]
MILKKFGRAVICALVLGLVLITLSSCAQTGQVAMTLTYNNNTSEISSNIYSYYLSYTKTMTLANLYGSIGYGIQDIVNMGDIDIPDYWASPANEFQTIGEAVKEQAETTVKHFLAIAAYCKEHKLDISRETRNDIDESIRNLINSEKYRRSKAALNAVLIRFNIDDSILKEIRRLEALTGVFSRHAFDPENGGREISGAMIEAAYSEMCSRVKHILIKTSPGTRDAEGNDIEYTAEEMAEVLAKIEDIYERASGGEDFDGMLSESADRMTAEGYTVREDTPFVPEFLHAAFDMEIGEVRKVETSHGIHIMKRFELLPPEEAVNLNTGESWYSAISKDLMSYLTADILAPYIREIETNRAETDLFDIVSSEIMFDCLEILQ